MPRTLKQSACPDDDSSESSSDDEESEIGESADSDE